MPIRSFYGKRSKDREARELKQHMNIPTTAGYGGVTDHGALTGLADDDHANYVHITAARSIQAQHTYSPVSPAAPFVLAANAQGQLVTGFKADQLDKQVIAGDGLITGGTLTSDVTLAVGAGDGINVLANAIEVDVTDLIATGLVEVATNNIGHGTGDFGDMHTNYAEHDQTESITGAWTFSTSDVTINGVDLVFAVDSRIESTAGNITVAPAGDLILDPVGNDVLPYVNYDINLGALSKKYLTLHAAELWVETLVAQNTIATIGGRILVGPTTTLTEDLPPTPDAGSSTMTVKHNQMSQTDRVYMEADGKVEFMAISAWQITDVDSGADSFSTGGNQVQYFPVGKKFQVRDSTGNDGEWTVDNAVYTTETIIYVTGDITSGTVDGHIIHTMDVTAGPFTYITWQSGRNLDGSGSNQWYAGDAVFNTGQTGDGFIDLYSVQGIHGSGAGPTIAGWTRTGTTYSNIVETWAIGNLNGLYGFGSDEYGVGLGRYAATYNHLTIDDTNGIRFFEGTGTVIAQWNGTTITLGEAAGGEYLTIGSTGIKGFTGGFERFEIDTAGVMTLGYQAGGEYVTVGSTGIEIFTAAGQTFDVDASGNVKIGKNVAVPADNYFSIFATAQTYNTESMAAGDMLLGDNSASKANIFWDKSAGELLFRAGQVSNIKLDTSGTLVLDDAGAGATGYLQWKTGATVLGKINFSHVPGSSQERFTFSIDTGLASTRMFYFTGGEEAYFESMDLNVQNNVSVGQGLYVGTTGGVPVDNEIRADGSIKTLAGLSVGSFTSNPGNGDIWAADDINVQSGLYVGGVGVDVGGGHIITTTALWVNETANTKLTQGLTMNQTFGDEILSLKAAGVNHGMTAQTEFDTWFAIKQWSVGAGGAQLIGLSDGSQARGVSIHGAVQTYDATHTSAAVGVVTIEAHWQNSTTWQAVGTNTNLCTWRNNGSSRMTLTGDGRLFLDSTSTINKWDDYDDIALLHGFRAMSFKEGLNSRFTEFVEYAKPILVATGVMEFGKTKDEHPFINILGLQTLTIDALRQFHGKQTEINENIFDKLARYERMFLKLGVDINDPKKLH